jgi:hypothetical protein
MRSRGIVGCPLSSGLIGLLLTTQCPTQEPGDKPPNLDRIAEAGRISVERMKLQAASWSATTTLGPEASAVIQVVTSPAMRRFALFIEAKGRRSEAFRIIDRDGLWYTVEGRKLGRYRPYEAPFDIPNAYYFLARSDPQFLTEPRGDDLGVYEGTNEGIATYRSPLPEPVRRQLIDTIAALEEVKQQSANQSARAAADESIRRMQDLVQNGRSLKIDVASGLVVRVGTPERPTELHDFRWLDQVDDRDFRVAGRPWEDNTDDPTRDDLSELVMISHSGSWRPGNPSRDTDGRLLDVRSGRYRRIPFHGAQVSPGCFLKNRTRVAVTGLDVVDGTLGLYEVNLSTGENRRLGGELLASGMSLMPALSPDGTTLAVLHKGPEVGLLETRVCLVNLATGEARALGEPADMAFLSWFPDSKALLLLHREAIDPANLPSPRTESIARMDMDGAAIRHYPAVAAGAGAIPVGDSS